MQWRQRIPQRQQDHCKHATCRKPQRVPYHTKPPFVWQHVMLPAAAAAAATVNAQQAQQIRYSTSRAPLSQILGPPPRGMRPRSFESPPGTKFEDKTPRTRAPPRAAGAAQETNPHRRTEARPRAACAPARTCGDCWRLVSGAYYHQKQPKSTPPDKRAAMCSLRPGPPLSMKQFIDNGDWRRAKQGKALRSRSTAFDMFHFPHPLISQLSVRHSATAGGAQPSADTSEGVFASGAATLCILSRSNGEVAAAATVVQRRGAWPLAAGTPANKGTVRDEKGELRASSMAAVEAGKLPCSREAAARQACPPSRRCMAGSLAQFEEEGSGKRLNEVAGSCEASNGSIFRPNQACAK